MLIEYWSAKLSKDELRKTLSFQHTSIEAGSFSRFRYLTWSRLLRGEALVLSTVSFFLAIRAETGPASFVEILSNLCTCGVHNWQGRHSSLRDALQERPLQQPRCYLPPPPTFQIVLFCSSSSVDDGDPCIPAKRIPHTTLCFLLWNSSAMLRNRRKRRIPNRR